MENCFCKRLYRTDKSTLIAEHAFSGSLCYVRQFETWDGLRFCLTIFSLSDGKHLHFPHNEYKLLCSKLYALQSTRSILPIRPGSDILHVKERLCDFQIKFGCYTLAIGPVTAIGLVNTAPFADVDVFSVIDKQDFTCIPELDLCVCKGCPVFKRLHDFEALALTARVPSRAKNVLLFKR